EQAVALQARQQRVDGALGDGQPGHAAEPLDDLVAVGLALAERRHDAQLDQSLAQLRDPELHAHPWPPAPLHRMTWYLTGAGCQGKWAAGVRAGRRGARRAAAAREQPPARPGTSSSSAYGSAHVRQSAAVTVVVMRRHVPGRRQPAPPPSIACAANARATAP